MRIAHASLFIDYFGSHADICEAEARASVETPDLDWHVHVMSPHKLHAREHVQWHHLSVPFSNILTNYRESNALGFYASRAITLNYLPCRFAFNRLINKLTAEYDCVLVRYNPADLAAWTALKSPEKVIPIHHNFPVEELALRSSLGAWAERVTGPRQMRSAPAVCGVTPEIAAHEINRCKLQCPPLVLPNGLFVDQEKGLVDDRTDTIRILLAASEFAAWHGLDRILARALEYSGAESFELHLAGPIPAALQAELSDHAFIHWHGLLDREKLNDLSARCDIGLGSFGMDRVGLSEGSKLKILGYLAQGLPVATGCREPAFPGDFPQLLVLSEQWRWEEIIDFCQESKAWRREEVRNAAWPYIDYRRILPQAAERMRAVLPPGA